MKKVKIKKIEWLSKEAKEAEVVMSVMTLEKYTSSLRT
jgi:hypothetical protein